MAKYIKLILNNILVMVKLLVVSTAKYGTIEGFIAGQRVTAKKGVRFYCELESNHG